MFADRWDSVMPTTEQRPVAMSFVHLSSSNFGSKEQILTWNILIPFPGQSKLLLRDKSLLLVVSLSVSTSRCSGGGAAENL